MGWGRTERGPWGRGCAGVRKSPKIPAWRSLKGVRRAPALKSRLEIYSEGLDGTENGRKLVGVETSSLGFSSLSCGFLLSCSGLEPVAQRNPNGTRKKGQIQWQKEKGFQMLMRFIVFMCSYNTGVTEEGRKEAAGSRGGGQQ